MKSNGFGKKGLNFYKKKDDLIFVFNFQNSHGNSGNQTRFYINCGIHSRAIDKAIGRTELLEPKEYECYYRKRISSLVNSDTDGYNISEETDLSELSARVHNDLQTVIHLFDDIHATKDLTGLMIKQNGLNKYRELFKFLLLTQHEADITRFVKQLYNHFGTDSRWASFKSDLNELLMESNRTEIVEVIIDKG